VSDQGTVPEYRPWNVCTPQVAAVQLRTLLEQMVRPASATKTAVKGGQPSDAKAMPPSDALDDSQSHEDKALLLLSDARVRTLLDRAVAIHETLANKGATPSKFVAFLDTYVQLYQRKERVQQQQRKHLAAGNTAVCVCWNRLLDHSHVGISNRSTLSHL